MRFATLIGAFGLAAIGAQVAPAQQNAPGVLVVQTLVPPDNNVNPNVLVRSFFEKQFADDGRLQPIGYSMADPAFRAAFDAKKVTNFFESPTQDQALEAADQLGSEYAFVVQALKHQTTVYADAKLFKGRREVWRDRAQISAELNQGFSLENAVASLARTWLIKIGDGPLKDMPRHANISTPPVEPPVEPIRIDPDPVESAPQRADNTSLMEEVERLLRLGERNAAVATLRGAVDAEPLDVDRRVYLSKVLIRVGRLEEAAMEARRATSLFPDNAEFRFVSAECAIASGNLQGALTELTESLVRSPKDTTTRILLSEVCLYLGRSDHALGHLKVAEESGVTLATLFRRTAAEAAKGQLTDDSDAVKTMRELWSKSAEAELASQRGFAQKFFAYSGGVFASEIRDLIQLARLKTSEDATKKRLESLIHRVGVVERWRSATEFISLDPKSIQRVVLAYRLLAQSLAEVKGHLNSPNEGLAEEATITLGEAMKAIELAKAEFIQH